MDVYVGMFGAAVAVLLYALAGAARDAYREWKWKRYWDQEIYSQSQPNQ